MTNDAWYGGLEPEIDYMLRERPVDPEMRESASIWLYEENGDFGFPRIGIEAIGSQWDSHGFQVNFVNREGRAILGGGAGPTHSPMGARWEGFDSWHWRTDFSMHRAVPQMAREL